MVETLFITGELVQRVLPMGACIEAMAATFADLAGGGVGQPLRTVVPLASGHGLLGLMPADGSRRGVMGIKALSVFPDNAAAGLPSHQGVVLLFESQAGRLLAVIDAAAITALRTAAVSAVATRALARRGSSTLALLGAGVQARSHLEAMGLVRGIESVRVWDVDAARSAVFAATADVAGDVRVEAVATAREAAAGADVICTLTPAREPILRSEWVEAGAHVNAVGACTPDAHELDSALVARSRLFADSRESLLAESGDFLIPLAEGAIAEEHLRGELGDVVTGRVRGRRDDHEVTVFESLGLACEDLAAAEMVHRRCREQGLGILLSQ